MDQHFSRSGTGICVCICPSGDVGGMFFWDCPSEQCVVSICQPGLECRKGWQSLAGASAGDFWLRSAPWKTSCWGLCLPAWKVALPLFRLGLGSLSVLGSACLLGGSACLWSMTLSLRTGNLDVHFLSGSECLCPHEEGHEFGAQPLL